MQRNTRKCILCILQRNPNYNLILFVCMYWVTHPPCRMWLNRNPQPFINILEYSRILFACFHCYHCGFQAKCVKLICTENEYHSKIVLFVLHIFLPWVFFLSMIYYRDGKLLFLKEVENFSFLRWDWFCFKF